MTQTEKFLVFLVLCFCFILNIQHISQDREIIELRGYTRYVEAQNGFLQREHAVMLMQFEKMQGEYKNAGIKYTEFMTKLLESVQ